MTDSKLITPPEAFVKVSRIDTDVHPAPRSLAELREYMDEPWRSMPAQAFTSGNSVIRAPGGGFRGDTIGQQEEDTPGSDPELAYQQLLVDAGVDFAVLMPLVKPSPNPHLEAAAAAAMNRWQVATWLGAYNSHGRYRGSICVSLDDPESACREIEEWAAHPYFSQVRVNTYSDVPLGDPKYHPMFETAEKNGIPVALHFSKATGQHFLTPSGFPKSYFEWHITTSANYSAQLTSMIFGGVFDKYPELVMVFIEGGVSWLIPMVWRLDNIWRATKGLHPTCKRLPSEYIRKNVRLTTQPVDDPADKTALYRLYDAVDAESILMFSTDYPHWDYDNPLQPVFDQMPEHMRERIMWKNAAEVYSLPDVRAA